MITRRSRMPMRQENPRTFALNTSKGMDESRSPVDASTAYRITNLTVNPDGSLSPRKPIVSAWRLTDYSKDVLKDTTRVEYLHDKRFRIAFVNGGFFILDENNQKQAVRIYVTDTKYVYDYSNGTELSAVASNGIDFSNAEITTLSTTTVISNVLVSFYKLLSGTGDYAYYEKIVPEELYDNNKAYFPRYLQLYYSEDLGMWRLDIKTPEVNRLNLAEGELMLNPNMTLDNPYALRDGYDSAVPVVRGILAYSPSKIVDGKPVAGSSELSGKRYDMRNVFGAQLASPQYISQGAEGAVAVLLTMVPSSYAVLDYGQVRVTFTCAYSLKDADEDTSYSLSVNLNVKSPSNTADAKHVLNFTKDSHTANATLDVMFNVSDFPDGVYESSYLTYASVSGIANTVLDPAGTSNSGTVRHLTESVKAHRYRIVSTFDSTVLSSVVLKAFCDFPNESSSTTYAAWFKSHDGVVWKWVEGQYGVGTPIYIEEPVYDLDSAGEDASKTAPTEKCLFYPFYATSNDDAIQGRIDVLNAIESSAATSSIYMFKVISVEHKDGTGGGTYTKLYEHGKAIYTPVLSDKLEFLHTDFGNTSLGRKLYHKKSLYSYGAERFKNNIFVSAIDSFETPLYNIIDLDAVSASKVTCLIPWRDYLISSTESAVYLHAKQDLGYVTKTLTTSIGVPEHDAECCKAILNGIVLKSGSKLYYLYPNLYSGEDSSLSVTDISLPVEEMLLEHSSDDCFAFVTNSEYILVFRKELTSTVLRYDFTTRIWLTGSYPVAFDKVKTLGIDDIRIFGTWNRGNGDDVKLIYGEFKFDTSYEDGFISETDDAYGDVLLTLTDTAGNIAVSKRHEDIAFELDTGQKTDDIAYQHQFVESRLVFATGDEFEYFPLEAVVSVDGDPRQTRIDVNSDAAFWKDDFNTKGVASTSIRMTSTDPDRSVKGILRQLILRYNVKGRSIRHIVSGKATRPFKLYETYVKYKPTNK